MFMQHTFMFLYLSLPLEYYVLPQEGGVIWNYWPILNHIKYVFVVQNSSSKPMSFVMVLIIIIANTLLEMYYIERITTYNVRV